MHDEARSIGREAGGTEGEGLSFGSRRLRLVVTSRHLELLSFAVELFVDEEDEEVDVDLGSFEHLHDCHTFVLQLQQVL